MKKFNLVNFNKDFNAAHPRPDSPQSEPNSLIRHWQRYWHRLLGVEIDAQELHDGQEVIDGIARQCLLDIHKRYNAGTEAGAVAAVNALTIIPQSPQQPTPVIITLLPGVIGTEPQKLSLEEQLSILHDRTKELEQLVMASAPDSALTRKIEQLILRVISLRLARIMIERIQNRDYRNTLTKELQKHVTSLMNIVPPLPDLKDMPTDIKQADPAYIRFIYASAQATVQLFTQRMAQLVPLTITAQTMAYIRHEFDEPAAIQAAVTALQNAGLPVSPATTDPLQQLNKTVSSANFQHALINALRENRLRLPGHPPSIDPNEKPELAQAAQEAREKAISALERQINHDRISSIEIMEILRVNFPKNFPRLRTFEEQTLAGFIKDVITYGNGGFHSPLLQQIESLQAKIRTIQLFLLSRQADTTEFWQAEQLQMRVLFYQMLELLIAKTENQEIQSKFSQQLTQLVQQTTDAIPALPDFQSITETKNRDQQVAELMDGIRTTFRDRVGELLPLETIALFFSAYSALRTYTPQQVQEALAALTTAHLPIVTDETDHAPNLQTILKDKQFQLVLRDKIRNGNLFLPPSKQLPADNELSAYLAMEILQHNFPQAFPAPGPQDITMRQLMINVTTYLEHIDQEARDNLARKRKHPLANLFDEIEKLVNNFLMDRDTIIKTLSLPSTNKEISSASPDTNHNMMITILRLATQQEPTMEQLPAPPSHSSLSEYVADSIKRITTNHPAETILLERLVRILGAIDASKNPDIINQIVTQATIDLTSAAQPEAIPQELVKAAIAFITDTARDKKATLLNPRDNTDSNCPDADFGLLLPAPGSTAVAYAI